MTELAAFRVYATTLESVDSLKNATLKKEAHIVLAFARDYDKDGINTKGKFVPYFDSTIDHEKIQAIRNSMRGTTVKLFVSIGGRNQNYPFQIASGEQEEWIGNAVQTLKDIVKKYKLDGIDVYYEHFKSGPAFAPAMSKVISKLKSGNENVTVSLTVTAPNSSLYDELYKKEPLYFDHVVYQTHSEPSLISTFDELVQIFDKPPIPTYPKTKIFAGHSLLLSDWKNVSLPIFLGAIPKLLEKEIVSISGWIETDHDHET